MFVSQKKLRRAEQVSALIQAIQNGETLPLVRLREAEDGTVQVDDGHHRVVAYWLSGRDRLARHEYRLVLTDLPRPRFGRIADLLRRINREDGRPAR